MRHPHARKGRVPREGGLLADGARARALARRGRRLPSRAPFGAHRVLHPRRALRELFGPVLHQRGDHGTKRQQGRLRAALPPALRRLHGVGRADRPPQPRAFAARQQPDRQSRGPDRRGRLVLQDRGPPQGPRLREEHHGLVPSAARCHHRATPRTLPHLRRRLDLQLHARPREELPEEPNRLLRARPSVCKALRARPAREPQEHGQPRRLLRARRAGRNPRASRCGRLACQRRRPHLSRRRRGDHGLAVNRADPAGRASRQAHARNRRELPRGFAAA